MASVEAILKGGDNGAALVLGDPEKSSIFSRADDGSMPPAGKVPSAAEKKLIHDWILSAKGGRTTK